MLRESRPLGQFVDMTDRETGGKWVPCFTPERANVTAEFGHAYAIDGALVNVA